MDYVSRIAASILSRTSCVSILGPETYTAIAEWEKKGIPLAIVMISIEEVCGDNADIAGTAQSVEKLHSAVGKNFRIWLANGAGQKAIVA